MSLGMRAVRLAAIALLTACRGASIARDTLPLIAQPTRSAPTSTTRWAMVAVPLVRRSDLPWFIGTADGADRWALGALRAKLDGSTPVVLGEAPRAPIVAVAPIAAERAWLLVTEDGAAWRAQDLDGSLERVEPEAGSRVSPLSSRSSALISLRGREGSVFFADPLGMRRAPESMTGSVFASSFVDERWGFAIEAPGFLLESSDGGRTFRRRTLSDAALTIEPGPSSALVRTARGWLELERSGAQRAHPGPIRAPRLARVALDELARKIAVAAAFEPVRGRALALSLGAVLLRDGVVALVDGDDVVLLRQDRAAQRVQAPCDAPRLHPFGDRVVLECHGSDASDEHGARYFVGAASGFEPLGGSGLRAPAGFDPSRVHVAPDGSAVLIEGGCEQRHELGPVRGFGARRPVDADPSGELCVVDGAHSPRRQIIDRAARILAVRGGRVLFDVGGGVVRGRLQLGALRVASLSATHSDVELAPSVRWVSASLAPDGSVYGTASRAGRLHFVRVEPGSAPELRPLPPGAERVVALDPRRWLAIARGPTAVFESDDRGAHWTARSLNIDGASSIPIDFAPLDRASERPPWLGRSDWIAADRCMPIACELGDGLVYADESWLAVPPLRAARRAQDSDQPRDPPRAQLGPVEALWFCGDAAPSARAERSGWPPPRSAPASAAAPPANPALDEAGLGEPGARGWLAVEEHGGLFRARWRAIDERGVFERSSVAAPLAPLALAPQQAPRVSSQRAPSSFRLRLATREYAVIERCSERWCDVLLAPSSGAARVLLTVGAQLSGERWSARLHAAEPSRARGGFVLWLTHSHEDRREDSQTLDEVDADAVLSFDRSGAALAARTYAWSPSQWALRALGFDGVEHGIVVASHERSEPLRFFSLSGQRDGVPLTSRISEDSEPCARPDDDGPWLLTSRAGWAPLVYARGRAAAFEQGVRARYMLTAPVACLRELRVDPDDDGATALQRALRAAIWLRAGRSADVRPALESSFVSARSVERAWCRRR